MSFMMLTSMMVTVLTQPSLPPVPLPERILSTLRPDHPRLIILEADVARARRLVETDKTARNLRDQLRAEAEKMMESAPVVHRLIGPRLLDQSRTCLVRVYVLATLYRLEGDARFAKRAEQEMLAAAAFPDWNPRHFLDTAEMTHALAVGYDWLYDVLSPQSRATIRMAIVEKGLKPGEEVYRKDRGWARAVHNWNQVCNGGMTAGALAVGDEEPALAGYIVSKASESIRLPTARLAPDGGWDEGPGYWNYAMSYTACYLAAVQSALGTDFGLSRMAGLKETGLFRIHSIGPTLLPFNYADAGESAGSAPHMYHFARLFNRPVYATHQRRCGRRTAGLDLLWYDPRGTEADLERLPPAAHFKNVDVAFLRGDWTENALFVGFKGGDNAANHSHLDLGTFVLDAAGVRWASDLGPDDYNLPGYFGDKRWTYYRLRTEGQNTLVIDGQNQEPRARAPVIAFKGSRGDESAVSSDHRDSGNPSDANTARSFAIVDLTAAYSRQARKVRRGIALVDRKAVIVQDEIESDRSADVEWVMHTVANVKIDGPEVLLEQDDRQFRLRAVEAAGGTWSAQPVKIASPQRPLRGVNRLALRFKMAPPLTRVVVEMGPEDAGQPARASARVQPLAQWK